MDDLEKRLRKELRRHRVTEGDVIPFPVKKKEDLVQKIQHFADELPRAFEAQAKAERSVIQSINKLRLEGESAKKKFYVPFIMNDYVLGTNPIQALVWVLEEYLEYGETERKHSKVQIKYAYEFLDNNLSTMLYAIEKDLGIAEGLLSKTLNLSIPIPNYAARPIDSYLVELKELRRKLQDFRMYDGIFAHPERRWSTRQSEHRNQLLHESVRDNTFKRATTNMPWYDEMLDKPEYFEEEKGIIFMIHDMHPDEYLRRCIEGFRKYHNIYGDIFRAKEKDLAIKYAKLMLDGVQFPMLTLDYTGLSFGQEGIHRAWAAKLAGYDTVPVMIVDNTAEKKNKLRQREQR